MNEFIILIPILAILYILLSDSRYSYHLDTVLRKHKKQIVLDSCALIDGRIVDVARTGFVSDEIIIPKFVLHELQLLADGKDAHKRERARFGLDVAAQLQHYTWITTRIDDTKNTGKVDDMLLALCKRKRAALCTTDVALLKLADIEHIRVLNINELAQKLRPVVLPGEAVQVSITQKGKTADQGVGYLADGTMIVVRNAKNKVGATVTAIVDQMHQTAAGKMVFAHMEEPTKSQPITLKVKPVVRRASPRRTI